MAYLLVTIKTVGDSTTLRQNMVVVQRLRPEPGGEGSGYVVVSMGMVWAEIQVGMG